MQTSLSDCRLAASAGWNAFRLKRRGLHRFTPKASVFRCRRRSDGTCFSMLWHQAPISSWCAAWGCKHHCAIDFAKHRFGSQLARVFGAACKAHMPARFIKHRQCGGRTVEEFNRVHGFSPVGVGLAYNDRIRSRSRQTPHRRSCSAHARCNEPSDLIQTTSQTEHQTPAEWGFVLTVAQNALPAEQKPREAEAVEQRPDARTAEA